MRRKRRSCALIRGSEQKRRRLCDTIRYPSAAQPLLDSDEQTYTEYGITELHALREEKVREEIAGRLRGVCANFSDEDFQRLVGDMARRQVKDERRLIW